MKENVIMLKGNEPPLTMEIDDKHYLPEYDQENPANSCLGGIKAHSRKGRIVVSNTLDERLKMTYLDHIMKIAEVIKIRDEKIVVKKSAPKEEKKEHH